MDIHNIVMEYVVADVNRSANFFQEILRFSLEASEKEGDKMYWAKLSSGSFQLSLKDEQRVKKEVDFFQTRPLGGSITLCLEVKNLQETYQEVQKQCELLNYPHLTPCGATEFSIKDPNGYFITFEQHDQR